MRTPVRMAALGLVLAAAACGAPAPVTLPAPAAAPEPVVKPAAAPAPRVVRKPPAARPAARVDSTRLEADLLAERAHGPLAWVLSRRSGNAEVAGRAAEVLLREARRLRIAVSLAAAVMLVENTPLDTSARSVAGAVGLMQVMPVHGGSWGCASSELRELEANICHGVGVLTMYLHRSRTVQTALRRYNGCVGRRVTRRCLGYPDRVLRTASRVRREMLLAPPEADLPKEPPPAPPYWIRRRE